MEVQFKFDNNHNIIMGCGCLSPPKQKEEVYAYMINLIHEEAPNINSTTNLDLYQTIKEKIIKKGYLRKLIDNLASHRSKIPDSMSQNLQLVRSSKQLANRYAGIIVADHIIDGIYKNQGKPSKITDKDSEYQSQAKISNNSKMEVKNDLLKEKNMSVQLYEPLSREIDSRFDLSYFNLILFLLQHEKRMYHRLLDSLMNFCTKREEKFLCEGEIWKILNILLRQIDKETMLLEGSKTYHHLLNKTKEHISQEFKNPKILYQIIKQWMKDRDNSQISQEIRDNFQLILQTYFNRCISCWESEFLIQVIFKIFDELHFQPKKIQRLQNQIQSIVSFHDLSHHFFRGILIFLFNYLSYSPNVKGHKNWLLPQFQLKFIKMKVQYKNIGEEEAKMNGFTMLSRWIERKYVSLDEIILYNYKSILLAFTTNFQVFKSSKKILNKLAEQFLKMLKFASEESRQILVLRMLQELKEQETESSSIQVLLKLIKQVVGLDKQFCLNANNFFMEVRLNWPAQLKFETIMLVSFILEHKKSIEHEDMEYRHEICEFLTSIYNNILIESESLLFKYRFVCTVISFMRTLLNFMDKAIAIALISIIDSLITNKKIPVDSQYCLLYLGFEIRHLLFKHFKVPSQIIKINYKITTDVNLKAIRGQATEYLADSEPLELNKIKDTAIFNPNIYREYEKILRQNLSQVEKPEPNSSQIRISRKGSHFEREDSVLDADDEPISGIYLDKSFQQILDIIND